VKKLLIVVLFFVVVVPFLAAQTNPAPQLLPYLQNFGTSSFSTLPVGLAVWGGLAGSAITSQTLAESSVPTADASIAAVTTTQTTGAAYGYASGSNAMIYFQQSSAVVTQLVLALNTSGSASVTIGYKIVLVVATPRTIGVVLQYRLGHTGGWTTIPQTVYAHNNTTRTQGQTDEFSSLLLPSDAANQSEVQIRWALWRGTETGVGSAGVGIDDITVTGTTGTIVNNPASFKINLIADTKMNLTWQLPSGSYDSIMVFGCAGAPVDYMPRDSGKNYLNASSHWLSAGTYGNSKLLYSGTSTEVQIDELTVNTAYYFQAFTFKDTTYSSGTVQVIDTSVVQGINALAAIAGDAQASVTWINYIGEQGVWWDEVLVLAKAGSTVDVVPSGDASSYTANSTFGSGTTLGTNNFVVYKGLGSSFTLSGLANGTTYHLLALVRNGSNWTAASKQQRVSFVSGQVITIPSAPALLTPTDGASRVIIPPVCTWSVSTGASTYELQCARDAVFTTDVIDTAGLTGTSFTLQGLTAGIKYYWRVRAMNTAGTSVYSAVNSFTTFSSSPGGITQTYYQSAYKLYGSDLRGALHNIIANHNVVSYASLWTYYTTTDIKPNGMVWDMYSDLPGATPPYEFTFITKQCGNYSVEGDCYNREHSWPQQWFNDSKNPEPTTDLFNVYPTDGKVNGMRNNNNYGTVGSATWTSQNGSKLGSCTYPGFTGTVFEPINAYKGDFARSHFYMSVRYYTEDGTWSSSGGTNKSDLLPWYANQMYDWHIMDMVSEKEINRNTAVYGIQHNRNPFIDHPEFAAEIWKTDMPPAVVSVMSVNPTTTIVDFSRYLDSASAVANINFVLSGSGNPTSVQWGVNNDVSQIQLTTSALVAGSICTLQINNQKSINNIAMSDTTITFTVLGTTSVSRQTTLPKDFRLEQNFPNPFNPVTNIEFRISNFEFVKLSIFDLLGRPVATLVNEEKATGTYTVSFDAANLPSGVYFYRLTAGQFTATQHMLLLK